MQEIGENGEVVLARVLSHMLSKHGPPRQQMPMYHVILDLRKNIENLSGDGQGPRPKDWIEYMESKIRNWPENYILETARIYICGGARDWF